MTGRMKGIFHPHPNPCLRMGRLFPIEGEGIFWLPSPPACLDSRLRGNDEKGKPRE